MISKGTPFVKYSVRIDVRIPRVVKWLLHFRVLSDMFNYLIFYNLTLASQVQFLFALMHILNNSWYVIENAQVC